MNNTLLKTYIFSDIYFDIISSGFKKVGNKQEHPDIDFEWKTTTLSKFKHWGSARIWCVDEGEAEVETTFGSFKLKPKHAYYIPQGTLLAAKCDDYMAQYFIDFLPYSELIPLDNFFSFNHESDNFELICPLIKTVIQHKRSTNECDLFKITTSVNAILAHFVKDLNLSHDKFKPFLQAITQINANYKSELSISHLASSIGYNGEYFSRAFKTAFGISPQTYIINKRLSVAKHLLLTTDLPISTIATECGYSDPLYFTKAFTKHMGMSPTLFKLATKTEDL